MFRNHCRHYFTGTFTKTNSNCIIFAIAANNDIVAIVEKRLLPAIASLRDVVGQTRNNPPR